MFGRLLIRFALEAYASNPFRPAWLGALLRASSLSELSVGGDCFLLPRPGSPLLPGMRVSLVTSVCFASSWQDRDLLGWAAHFKVPADLVQVLSDESWDIATFGMCATSVSEVDAALSELLPLRAFSLQERASIRLLWQQCFALASKSAVTSASPAGASDHALQGAGNQDSTSSWSTPFPPKVASTAVVAMQKDFLKSYTSEILDQDTLPSPRLLALVKANVDNLESKVGWRWVPWKFRLSQKAHDDKDSIALSSRPRKIAKLDLSDLLLDDIPLREIPSSGQLGNYQLSQILSLHSVAVALCKGCHLSTLRAYDRAFLELATKRYASDLNLRSPLASELEHADRMLWDQVSTLLSEDWKLDVDYSSRFALPEDLRQAWAHGKLDFVSLPSYIG